MKKIIATSLFLLATSLCGFTQIAQAAHDGIYVGVGLGEGNVKATPSNQNLSPASSYDDNGFAWRAAAGYQMNSNFALEAQYTGFSSVDFKNVKGLSGAHTTLDQQALGLVGKLMFPLGVGFNVFATGGLDYVNDDYSSNSLAKAAGAKNGSKSSARPTYGLGAGYDFYPGWSVQVSWDQIASGGNAPTSNFFAGGLVYHFG